MDPRRTPGCSDTEERGARGVLVTAVAGHGKG